MHTDDDERLTPLRGQAREWAADIEPHIAELDRDPGTVARLIHLPLLSRLATLGIPPEYGAPPLTVGGQRYRLRTALEKAVFFEEGARADLGLLFSVPGPDMSGTLVDTLGDRAQRDWFYSRLLERPTWTCFAMTEAGRGSDAARMSTTLTRAPDGGSLVLTGAKRYVGNAVRAGVAVAFARFAPGPLGIRAVLVDTASPGFSAEPVPTLGLRCLQLGAITLDAVEVPEDQLLGRHLPAVRQGMWGWLRTFNTWRTVIAAMGVGAAAAAHAYALRERPAATGADREHWDALARRIEGVRALTYRAARAVDDDPADGELASAAKLTAARLADDLCRAALRRLGPAARLEHPRLDKMARDAQGLELMEGTANVQRLAVFGALVRGGGARRR
ncbi:acyl-CoA dehydrogenase family protein [Streptomyces thermolilacinus]|uniref:Acyl-CoA dehydrogenase n=1 Tax=Streptomyces thermolilacinus SPC6 TaxID=1306406 RepID=A0A1D3DYE3_9ACTN|nr:acyl-CoA dehydrogenase family protein [Streptomyces thermolilacinus]OEJ97325.1 hypothetical protein J116_025605 [Streptomyces thermolilacinus SPC6]